MKLPQQKKRPYYSCVERNGKLNSNLLPAAFCDTSFLINYAYSDIYDETKLDYGVEQPADKLFINKYLKSDEKLKQIWLIRKEIENFNNKINLVYSPACRMEMEGRLSEINFKTYAISLSSFFNKNRKEIGDIIYKIGKDRIEENKKEPHKYPTELSHLCNQFLFTTSYEDMLIGLTEADVVNFKLTKKDFFKFGFLSNLQIGFADVFHLLSAKKMGCEYFFTFDGDFCRSKKDIEDIFQLEIVANDIERMKKLTC